MNYEFEIPSKRALIDSLDDTYKNDIESRKITTLSIAGNSYSFEFCQQFGEALMKQESIDTMNLNDIFVSRKKDSIP